MTVPPLTVHDVEGMTCLSVEGHSRKVAFAFVGRTGGVSDGIFSSLNVGDAVGDEAQCVDENRRRALTTIGVCGDTALADTVIPLQVHGTDVVCVNASDAVTLASVRELAKQGADAVIVTVPEVAVLMIYADCVPVVLVAPEGFAVIHSGWRGTLGRISAQVAIKLAHETSCDLTDIWAYIGPHVHVDNYEVSTDIADAFAIEFGQQVVTADHHLDLGKAVMHALCDVGIQTESICNSGIDTFSSTDQWFSHRASGGHTGRNAIVARLTTQH